VVSAKKVFITGMALLGVSILAALMVFAGLPEFRFLVFASVISGAVVGAVGLFALATGKMRNDLRD
jgi:hypothetical protein